jgi:hypothetical protein
MSSFNLSSCRCSNKRFNFSLGSRVFPAGIFNRRKLALQNPTAQKTRGIELSRSSYFRGVTLLEIKLRTGVGRDSRAPQPLPQKIVSASFCTLTNASNAGRNWLDMWLPNPLLESGLLPPDQFLYVVSRSTKPPNFQTVKRK